MLALLEEREIVVKTISGVISLKIQKKRKKLQLKIIIFIVVV